MESVSPTTSESPRSRRSTCSCCGRDCDSTAKTRNENRMSTPAPPKPGWHRDLRRWPPYSPGPLGRCESRRRDRRHHVFTLNTSRNRIQWPRWLKMGPAGPCPKKRNVQSTWGLPRHMGGVRQSARCPYGAAEPSWAMVRCISSSHPPILYTACVGLLQLLTHNQLGHSARMWSQCARAYSAQPIYPNSPEAGTM